MLIPKEMEGKMEVKEFKNIKSQLWKKQKKTSMSN